MYRWISEVATYSSTESAGFRVLLQIGLRDNSPQALTRPAQASSLLSTGISALPTVPLHHATIMPDTSEGEENRCTRGKTTSADML